MTESKNEKSSSTRTWLLLVGGIVLLIVGFDLVERLVRTEPTPSADGSAAEEDAAAGATPGLPELRRLEDGGIEIRHDFFRRSTIRLGTEDDQNALFDCLTRGIEQTFGAGTEDWGHGRVRDETQRILDECLGSFHDVPVPPRPPSRN